MTAIARNRIALAAFLALVLAGPVWSSPGDDAAKDKGEKSKEEMKVEHKRQEIDLMARTALDRLFDEQKDAKALYDEACGYAVFDTTKVALGVTGAGGSGVAVNLKTNERTYMRMGSAGVGVGLGAQSYNVVFLFEDEPTFRQFVDKGWEAEAQANAAAGTAGRNAETSFTKGLAVFQLTDSGLMASADIAGTKYWKADKLN